MAAGCWRLLECRLETGRTHQIRVHLTARGHAVVGDPLYGGRRGNTLKALPPEAAEALKNLHRQALHAYRLGFQHPLSGERIEIESEAPEDIRALLLAGQLRIS